MISFRRFSQLFCLGIFLGLLFCAGQVLMADLFLAMDPALVLLTVVATRSVRWIFLTTIATLIITLLFGRIFCGYICPMGTSIDLSDACCKPKRHRKMPSMITPRLKIYGLIFLIGAALLGVGLVFWAAPLSLITRFYGLVIEPVAILLLSETLDLLRPLADWMDIRSLMFVSIHPRRFTTMFFILLFFILAFSAVQYSPRFWCRYLCPSGGLLSLLSKRPVIKRQVSSACNQCGVCIQKCPMGAIDKNVPERIRHEECIVCKECEKKCPQNAISFSNVDHQIRTENGAIWPDRRRVLLTGLAGMGTAAVALSGINVVMDENEEGNVRAARLIRPPGALPEPDFLSRCVRCGECMTACPTNTLQPIWMKAGFLGMFSPAVTPRRNYCDPRCIVCGRVCPTGAILSLGPHERMWAKTGTAIIHRQKCLAWEHKKSCMVCDEVCPYDAVEFEKRSELPHPVPHVNEDKCAGCGYCEHYCPVEHDAAIVVTPMDAVRLREGRSFIIEGKFRGYDLNLRVNSKKWGGNGRPYTDLGPELNSGVGNDFGFENTAPGFDKGM